MAENSVNNNENLNSLSNDLIRKRLEEEFGFDCGPITQSTRSVYLKKLKQLINERNKDINETNHQNNSNNDNNDLNATNDDFNSNNTTQTMRLSTLRTPSQRNSPRRKLEEEFGATKTSTPKNRRQSSNPMSSQSKTAANPKSGRKSIPVMSSPRIVSSDANSHLSLTNYSSESSENEEVVEEELLLTIRKSPRKKPSTPPSRPLQEQLSSQRVPFARPYPPPPLKPMTTAVKPTTFSPLTRPPLRRSILSSGQDSAKLANYSDSEADTEHEQNDTIRERLLRHRPGLNINSIITTSKPSQSSTAVGFEDSNSYSNLISFAILALLVLFFVFIFSFYFYTRINSFPKSAVDLTDFHFIDEELVAPICQSDSAKDVFSDVSDNCLKYKSDIMPALTIVKEIKTFVDKTQLNYYCGPNDKKPILTDPKFYQIKDLKTAIMKGNIIINTNREGIKEGEDDIVIFNRDFINALTLIQLNPNWQLVCVKDSLGEIVKIGLSDDYPLNLPFGCHSMLLLNQYLWHILTAFMVIILGSVTYSYLKRSKRIRNEEQDLVYDLVEKSLELLQSPDNPTSMPVLHIRDTLLSPSERKSSKYKRIWNNVVKHIETVESRVKVEIENIEGDDYKTWKWVATNTGNSDGQVSSASTIIRTGGIEWQGQAFAADNNLNVSQTVSNSNNGGLASKSNFMAPTVFLKIRNMFDKETKLSDPLKWKTNIRNAVLEKTMKASKTGTHGIVHLEIEEDSNEGLVYLKCNSVQSATDTYNALHGWWCQKKLVSVKFLKSERYYQRFPDSANSSTPLALENK